MIETRCATESDIDCLGALDSFASENAHRIDQIRQSILTGSCFVATIDKVVAGYAILDYSFFDNGFVRLIYIGEDNRRRGVATELVTRLLLECKTAKLFTSTNQSNKPMHVLLAKMGFVESGTIHHLDDGDPEIIYYKALR